MIRRLQRAEDWSFEQIDATPAQFRKTLAPAAELSEVVKLAVHAGTKMAEQMAKISNRVSNLDRDQIEEWRRKYGVPKNRTNVMLMVAWSLLRHPKRNLFGKRTKERTLGLASPRVTAKQMIAHYGFRAEKMARILQKGNRKNRAHWTEVLAAMRVIRMKTKLLPTVNLARRGAGQLCSYLAKQKRALRVRHQIASVSSILSAPKRLVPHKVAYSPTLCLATDDLFHARCNRPVSMSGRVFCDVCQPRKERL